MKVTLIAVALCSIFAFSQAELTAEQKGRLQEFRDACSKQSGVDKDRVAEAKKGNLQEDAKLKQYLLCLAKKIGFVDEKGDIQKDVLKKKLGVALGDQALADKLSEECTVKKGDAADTVVLMVKCYYSKTPNNHVIL